MKLSELLKDYIKVPSEQDKQITGLALDSREIKSGDLFFACVGTQQDGREYIKAAIENGAIAIVCEAENGSQEISFNDKKDQQIPIVAINNLNKEVGEIAAKFYGYPSRALTIIGVTGTNGKTTVSHLCAAALTSLGYVTGVIGTLGYGLYQHIHPVNLTTPNPIHLQQFLAELVNDKAQYVVMEVSSHSLDQDRVAGIEFDIAIFTNLTRDHLDYHGDMETYAAAKRRLFYKPGLKAAIVNIDDEFGRILTTELQNQIDLYTYSAEGRQTDFCHQNIRAHQTNLDLSGITSSIHTPWGDALLHSPLLGRFNLNNLLAVVATLGVLNIALEDCVSQLMHVHGIQGRMEVFRAKNKPIVIVDFAHTPDALRQLLVAVREFCTGELWCVFGCGGDRDKGKRPQMGGIAENYGDHVVVTDDNPRHESATQIIADIMQGMIKPERAVIEHDRERAIIHAISCANKNDIVVIAGKGHENYQQIGDEKRPFSDALIVQMEMV